MKAIIIPNYEKPGVDSILLSLCSKLKELKIDYSVEPECQDFSLCDFIITIGGDGTIIHAAKSGAASQKPILGINAGRLGYLADITPYEFDKLSQIINSDYIIEERMMLEVLINSRRYFCLNDAVISKGALSRMIDIDIKVGNGHIAYRADGVIAATPTGSTAYSMSAGGPIADPSLGLFIISPICSNSLFDRPVLFNDDAVIEVSVNYAKNTEAYLTTDGENSIKIEPNDKIIIKRAALTAKLMRLHKHSFYKTLSEKMRG